MANLKNQLENTNYLNSLLMSLSNDPRVSDTLKRDIQDGRIKPRPYFGYIRRKVTDQATGTVELLTTNQDELEGVSSFKGQSLPQGQALIITKAIVSYGAGANIESVDLSTVLPGVAQGSHFRAYSDKKEIFDLPGSAFHAPEESDDPNKTGLDFDVPLFFGDAKRTKFEMEVPENVAFPDDTGGEKFIQLAVVGFVTETK